MYVLIHGMNEKNKHGHEIKWHKHTQRERENTVAATIIKTLSQENGKQFTTHHL